MRKTFIAAVILAAPRAALACPVCFGQSDAPMAWGTKMGIFFMLGLTGVVLASFAGFFIYLMRRARVVAAGAGPSADPAALSSSPQEGTAQC